MSGMRKPFGFRPEIRTAAALHQSAMRRRLSSASAPYAPSTTHPRKKPPWLLAQTRNSGGSNQSRRLNSRIAMVAARNRKVMRYGRSSANGRSEEHTSELQSLRHLV